MWEIPYTRRLCSSCAVTIKDENQLCDWRGLAHRRMHVFTELNLSSVEQHAALKNASGSGRELVHGMLLCWERMGGGERLWSIYLSFTVPQDPNAFHS